MQLLSCLSSPRGSVVVCSHHPDHNKSGVPHSSRSPRDEWECKLSPCQSLLLLVILTLSEAEGEEPPHFRGERPEPKKQIQKTAKSTARKIPPFSKPSLPDNSPHPIHKKTAFTAHISQNPSKKPHRKTANKIAHQPRFPHKKSTTPTSILQKYEYIHHQRRRVSGARAKSPSCRRDHQARA